MQCFCIHEQTACNGPMLSQHSDYYLYDCPIHIMCVSGDISESQAAARKNVFQGPENVRACVFQSNQALRSTAHLGRLCPRNQSPPTKEVTEEK